MGWQLAGLLKRQIQPALQPLYTTASSQMHMSESCPMDALYASHFCNPMPAESLLFWYTCLPLSTASVVL